MDDSNLSELVQNHILLGTNTYQSGITWSALMNQFRDEGIRLQGTEQQTRHMTWQSGRITDDGEHSQITQQFKQNQSDTNCLEQ